MTDDDVDLPGDTVVLFTVIIDESDVTDGVDIPTGKFRIQSKIINQQINILKKAGRYIYKYTSLTYL